MSQTLKEKDQGNLRKQADELQKKVGEGVVISLILSSLLVSILRNL